MSDDLKYKPPNDPIAEARSSGYFLDMPAPRATRTDMAMKRRYCRFCGNDMGVISDRYCGKRDTCGKLECERAAIDDAQAEREEAHRELDERMGW